MTTPQPTPRPHGWLWEIMSVLGREIMSVLGQLLVVIIIIAALAAAVAWLFGII
jgi:hypothetical protein